jgi:ribosome-binding factor A
MKTYPRSDRIGGLIHKTLSTLIQRDIHDPRLEMATITGVKMSRDLRKARIYFAISGSPEAKDRAARGFESAMGYIKRTLAQKLELRYMPELTFFYDESFDYGSKIDKVLESIKKPETNGPDHSTFD